MPSRRIVFFLTANHAKSSYCATYDGILLLMTPHHGRGLGVRFNPSWRSKNKNLHEGWRLSLGKVTSIQKNGAL